MFVMFFYFFYSTQKNDESISRSVLFLRDLVNYDSDDLIIQDYGMYKSIEMVNP